MPAAFRAPFPKEDARSAALWKDWLSTGNLAAYQELFERYAPFARVIACRCKSRRPDLFSESIDVLISDALIGVARCLRSQKEYGEYASHRIYWHACRTVYYFTRARRGGPETAKRMNEVEAIRSKLTQDLGRVPTPQEMLSAVRGVVANPMFYIDPPNAYSLEHDPIARGDDDPSERIIGAEAKKLAMKGLDARDRKLFRMILRGMSLTEIAKQMSFSRERARQRVNGLLWTLRSRVDLCEYFEQQPLTKPGHRARFLAPPGSARRQRIAV